MSEVMENFPRFAQATSDTPVGQPCLIPSTTRIPDACTCVFILNSPDVRTQHDLTEAEVRAACQSAGLSGLTHVDRQTHCVFVAFFSTGSDAAKARKHARLDFIAPTEYSASPARISVKAEAHWLEVNRVFIFETDNRAIKLKTVFRRVLEALQGPLASSFRLLKQNLRGKGKGGRQTRYILRPSEAVCPIFVERFYIPLDPPKRKGREKVWAIFKAVNRRWTCPACHEKCQAGEFSTCRSATLLGRASTAEN